MGSNLYFIMRRLHCPSCFAEQFSFTPSQFHYFIANVECPRRTRSNYVWDRCTRSSGTRKDRRVWNNKSPTFFTLHDVTNTVGFTTSPPAETWYCYTRT